MDVNENLKRMLALKTLDPNLEDRDKVVIHAFDTKFKNLSEVAAT